MRSRERPGGPQDAQRRALLERVVNLARLLQTRVRVGGSHRHESFETVDVAGQARLLLRVADRPEIFGWLQQKLPTFLTLVGLGSCLEDRSWIYAAHAVLHSAAQSRSWLCLGHGARVERRVRRVERHVAKRACVYNLHAWARSDIARPRRSVLERLAKAVNLRGKRPNLKTPCVLSSKQRS